MINFLSRISSIFDRLGFRLAAVLAIALLPLMIVSILRSQSVINEALARSQSALVGQTLQAVQREALLIEQAKAVAKSIGQLFPEILDSPDICNQMMRNQMKDTVFSFVGFSDTKGHVNCSTSPVPFSFEMTPQFKSQLENPSPIVLVNEDAPASGTSVIYASHPVFDDQGILAGFAAVSVPHKNLKNDTNGQAGAVFLTLNQDGLLLTAAQPLKDARAYLPVLPEGEKITEQPQSFRASGQDGVDRLYALVPITGSRIFALSTWPYETGLQSEFYLKNPSLIPMVMWLASLAVAWFATSIFITRHVLELRRAMGNFAATREVNTNHDFLQAPGELRDVANTFTEMTVKIRNDEDKIEESLRQKDILLREVHHRVKNNLQLIASIMSMQMRQTTSSEVKQLMQSLHDRVNSLATIHRNLYQTTGQALVRVDEQLEVIVNQVVKMGSSRNTSIDLTTTLDELHLDPDQAVPLSLFVTEALTNALKYIGNDDGKTPWLSVVLDASLDDFAFLTITNSTPREVDPNRDDINSTGLGAELMEAFSEQLFGVYKATAADCRYQVTLKVPLEELMPKK